MTNCRWHRTIESSTDVKITKIKQKKKRRRKEKQLKNIRKLKVKNIKQQVLSKMKTIQKIISILHGRAYSHCVWLSLMRWMSVIPMPHNVVRLWIVMHSFTDISNKQQNNIILYIHSIYNSQSTIRMKVISLHCRNTSNKLRIQLFKSWLSDDVRSFHYTIVSTLCLARRSETIFLALLTGKSETKSKQLFGCVWYARNLENLTEISNEPNWKLFHFTIRIDAKCECLRDFNYYILTSFIL